jgi:hypothetical protein
MREVALHNGLVAIVDDHDWPLVNDFNWFATRRQQADEAWYAICNEGGTVYMHRLILGAGRGQMVDHVDGDGLNNRRANLRFCNRRQNNLNRRTQNIGACPYRGVEFDARRPKPFRAVVWNGGKRTYLGHFTTGEEAAQRRDDAAREMYGEFARLNFPRPEEMGCA